MKELERWEKTGMAEEKISGEGSEKEEIRSIYSGKSRANSYVELSKREMEKIRKWVTEKIPR